MGFLAALILAAAAQIVPATAQLSGSVGPLTSAASKAAIKVCNIIEYGAIADGATDISTAFTDAYNDCIDGGEVYVPPGDYALENWISLKHGVGISININGIIYRTGTAGGNMFYFRDVVDLEIYSSTSQGAIQGYGYEFHKDGEYGPRILRLYQVSNFSVHDIALVDSPAFHLSIDTCESGEIYNSIIRGGDEGGLDGIDVWGTNIWIHDVEVTNKDECVTIKNPSSNILVESIHCNWSGGCAMGSLATDTDIHDIQYSNIYTHHSNQMYMIKSNGGNGTVSNVVFENFAGHSNAYSLDFDTQWSSMDVIEGDGILYSNISFTGWKGTCSDGAERGPIKVDCPALNPCYDITIEDFSMWTESGEEVLYVCKNAYGQGGCLAEAEDILDLAIFTTTQTVTAATSYAVATMANELTAAFDLSVSIPIPTIPASFFPGLAPKSAILSAGVSGSSLGSISSSALPSMSTSVMASSTSVNSPTASTGIASTTSAVSSVAALVSSSASNDSSAVASDYIVTEVILTSTTVCPVALTHTTGGVTSVETVSSTSTVIFTTTSSFLISTTGEAQSTSVFKSSVNSTSPSPSATSNQSPMGTSSLPTGSISPIATLQFSSAALYSTAPIVTGISNSNVPLSPSSSYQGFSSFHFTNSSIPASSIATIAPIESLTAVGAFETSSSEVCEAATITVTVDAITVTVSSMAAASPTKSQTTVISVMTVVPIAASSTSVV